MDVGLSGRRSAHFIPVMEGVSVLFPADIFYSESAINFIPTNAIKRASRPKPRQDLPGEESAHVLGGHLSPYYQEDEDDPITT